MADVALKAIENGPRCVPECKNGDLVKSLVVQPVTFALKDKPDLRSELQ